MKTEDDKADTRSDQPQPGSSDADLRVGDRSDSQLLKDALLIIEGFVLEDMNGVVCSVPEEGLDAPISRHWCERCKDRWKFAYDFLERMKGQVIGDTH